MSERWAPIVGWPKYEVSDLGRVRSWASRHKNKPIIRRPSAQASGYLALTFQTRKEPKTCVRLYVHRLVASAFCRWPGKNTEVARLDGNRQNNCYENLAWVSRKTNHAHKILHGTHRSGENHQSAKYSDAQFLAAIGLRKKGLTYGEIEKKTGVPGPSLCLVLKGRSRKHLLQGKRQA